MFIYYTRFRIEQIKYEFLGKIMQIMKQET